MIRAACCAALALALALTVAPGRAEAQTSLTKVTLKDGRVLEGTLLQELPNGDIKLILVSGDIQVLAGSEISGIARPGAAPAPASASEPQPVATASRQPPVEMPERPPPVERESHKRQRDDFDGLYGGGLVGGAVAPAFPGVAGVGAGEAFLGWRRSWFDLRVGVGGFGASFPSGVLGVAVVRPEVYFFFAKPYGFGFGFGPAIGHYDDDWLGSGVLYGSLATATPVALRFEAGEAFLEPSLSAGALFGSFEKSDALFVRPAAFLALAVYSK